MILPILLVVGLAVVGYKLGESKRQQPRIRGAQDMSAFRWNPRGFWERPRPGETNYMGLLMKVLNVNKTPSPALMNAAYQEASAAHNVEGMALIEQLALQLSAPPVAVGADLSAAVDSKEDYEDVTARQSTMAPTGPIASQKQSIPIPIADVDEANWRSFVDALKTKGPDYRSENHLGAYEHNRRRLRQLGIDESTLVNLDDQYNALCRDMADYATKCTQLIAAHVGDVIDLGGKQVPVTLSGLLALLKAAGVKGAEMWLTRADDRASHPNTTECFLRCNSCF